MLESRCDDNNYNKLIIEHSGVFERIHASLGHENKKSSLTKFNCDIEIIIPVTINICIDSDIEFIKYCKYMIDTLNDGFNGSIECIYKNNSNYSINYFKEIFKKKYNNEEQINDYAETIHKYINTSHDTKIRFILDSVVNHNKTFEVEFKDNNTELLISSFYKEGFTTHNTKNLNINIMKFNCKTLGVSTFPWMSYILKNIPNIMMIFIDYTTIHPSLSNSKFNKCKTLVHEAGHVFGLRHTFACTHDNLHIYSILLGKTIFRQEFINKLNKNNIEEYRKYCPTSHNDDLISKTDIKYLTKLFTASPNKLYHDVPYQTAPTNGNPIESGNYPFCNNIPVNFCCFMDYSQDDVLTHFTVSQARIMHYMIKIFKPYLIKNTPHYEHLDNHHVSLVVFNDKSIKHKYHYMIIYDTNNRFEFKIHKTKISESKAILKILNKLINT